MLDIFLKSSSGAFPNTSSGAFSILSSGIGLLVAQVGFAIIRRTYLETKAPLHLKPALDFPTATATLPLPVSKTTPLIVVTEDINSTYTLVTGLIVVALCVGFGVLVSFKRGRDNGELSNTPASGPQGPPDLHNWRASGAGAPPPPPPLDIDTGTIPENPPKWPWWWKIALAIVCCIISLLGLVICYKLTISTIIRSFVIFVALSLVMFVESAVLCVRWTMLALKWFFGELRKISLILVIIVWAILLFMAFVTGMGTYFIYQMDGLRGLPYGTILWLLQQRPVRFVLRHFWAKLTNLQVVYMVAPVISLRIFNIMRVSPDQRLKETNTTVVELQQTLQDHIVLLEAARATGTH
ncbi:hypothetical protein BDZ94DRAFT_1032660 [Collybia nuda]|uniref:Uncharacterized protein n=1 Tax=Collybia nuda TaxID=64659 RepID=A0A9P5YEE6_9AGAR|nr:hypothetical protein BDZ94DRAFT_1032660 [Collybia nuda]